MGKKILVIEDNPMNCRLIADILTYHNFTVITADNGESGIAMTREQMPDLILLDLQMPGMNGFETLQQIRDDPRIQGMKVVAVTSYAMAGDKKLVLAAGFDGYIAKPLDTKEFPQTVKKMIGEP
ncbi:MAG TPA: response regulator [Syntrophus sp. (in: bacteria)]|jgi:two-component system cell cycle response regulator DivK|nr:response regulator [Syntrophus sp. (in: bacteria)]